MDREAKEIKVLFVDFIGIFEFARIVQWSLHIDHMVSGSSPHSGKKLSLRVWGHASSM